MKLIKLVLSAIVNFFSRTIMNFYIFMSGNSIFVKWYAVEIRGIQGFESIMADSSGIAGTFLGKRAWEEKYRREISPESWQSYHKYNLPIFTLRWWERDSKLFCWLEDLQYI